MITKVSTKGMTEADWLAERAKSIGGSEIGAILGLNPFTSAYKLWAERTGRIPPFEGNLATKVGTALEDFVARFFTEQTGIPVERTNFIWRNDQYPHLHASPDRMIRTGRPGPAGLECKTTSSYASKLFHGSDFPTQYYAQCVQYMAVTECREWFLAVLVGNNEFHIFHLKRDEDLMPPENCEASILVEQGEIDELNRQANEFWDCIVEDRTPGMDGSDATADTLRTVFADTVPGQADLYGREELIKEYLTLKGLVKGYDARKTEIENILKADLGPLETGVCGQYKVSWKTQNRTTFDSKACLAANPAMSIYQKTSSSRVFSVK